MMGKMGKRPAGSTSKYRVPKRVAARDALLHLDYTLRMSFPWGVSRFVTPERERLSPGDRALVFAQTNMFCRFVTG